LERVSILIFGPVGDIFFSAAVRRETEGDVVGDVRGEEFEDITVDGAFEERPRTE
jgi:hypothetical protein